MCGFNTRYVFLLPMLMLSLQLFSAMPGTDKDKTIRSRYPFAELETAHVDMGEIKSGSRATGEVRLTNRGREDLLIGRVRSSCGLLIATWPTSPIGYGEEVTIRFSYDTRRLGHFERKLMIHTNAHQKTLLVTITGEVLPDQIEK